MKQVLSICALLLASFICGAQSLPIDSITQKVSFSDVVKVDGVSKDELYTRAMEWFSTTFKDAASVLDMNDEAAGKIICKGITKGEFKNASSDIPFTMNFKVHVTVADGSYSYDITEFTLTDDGVLVYATITAEELATKHKNADGTYSDKYKSYAGGINGTVKYLTAKLKTKMAEALTGN